MNGRHQPHNRQDHNPKPVQAANIPPPPDLKLFWNLDHGPHAGNLNGVGDPNPYGTNLVTGIVNTQESFNFNYAEASAKYQSAMTAYWLKVESDAAARENA